MKLSTYFVLAVTVLVSCDCSSNRGQQEEKAPSGSRGQQRIDAQRNFLEKERESIQSYLEDRDLEMERTGTGLHYQILKDSSAAKEVERGDEVEFEYDIYLMSGSLLYSSAESGNRELRIDKEDAEIGLHEALKMLGLGDKGRFILPSHLAFGVGGDQEKIPPKTPLVYELKVVNIQKSKS